MFARPIDQLIFDFNTRPAGYVHTSRLPDGLLPYWAGIQSAGQVVQDSVSAWLLRQWELMGKYDFDFAAPEKRLLLLDGDLLQDIALFLGLSALRRHLRLWISAHQARAVQEQLGDEKVRFLYGPVFTWREFGEVAADGLQPAALREFSLNLGVRLLRTLYHDAAEPSVTRALLKFPSQAGVASVAAERELDAHSSRRNDILEFAIGCVVKQRGQRWHWLF